MIVLNIFLILILTLITAESAEQPSLAPAKYESLNKNFKDEFETKLTKSKVFVYFLYTDIINNLIRIFFLIIKTPKII